MAKAVTKKKRALPKKAIKKAAPKKVAVKKAVRPAKLKIMVASTIYGFEDQLEQICTTLKQFGYEVWNSHMKTIPVNPAKSNTQNCLDAVAKCDLLFGIIRPQYGSGVIDATSITHQEMVKAIQLGKARWYVAHRDISVARQLLKQYMFDTKNKPIKGFTYRSTKVMDDIRVIDLYNQTIRSDVEPAKRVGHWVDEYFRIGDIMQCIMTQFESVDRIRDIITQMKKPPAA